MRNFEEIKNNQKIRIMQVSTDGFSGEIQAGIWRGTVIVSVGAGWEHVSVAPYQRRLTPTWDDMCKIKEWFWHDQEAVIQIHPPKADYVNQRENCLHLW